MEMGVMAKQTMDKMKKTMNLHWIMTKVTSEALQ